MIILHLLGLLLLLGLWLVLASERGRDWLRKLGRFYSMCVFLLFNKLEWKADYMRLSLTDQGVRVQEPVHQYEQLVVQVSVSVQVVRRVGPVLA